MLSLYRFAPQRQASRDEKQASAGVVRACRVHKRLAAALHATMAAVAKRPSSSSDTGRPPATFPDWSARLIIELLRAGQRVRFRAKGRSMWPAIPSGSLIEVTPCSPERLATGDVAAYEDAGRVVIHRVLENDAQGIVFAADASSRKDGAVPHAAVLGRARVVEARGLTHRLPSAVEVLVLGRGLARRFQGYWRRTLQRAARRWTSGRPARTAK